MTETVLCALTWSENGWTGGYERKPGDPALGPWVKQHRWAAEDWTFALAKAQLVGGKLYAGSQVYAKPARVAKSGGRFHVVFYTKAPDGRVGIVGAYRNAQYVSNGELPEYWKRAVKAGVASRRANELRGSFGAGKRGDKVADRFNRDRPLRWVVDPDDVFVFDALIPHAFKGWRPQNANKTKLSLSEWIPGIDVAAEDAESAGFPPATSREGALIQAQHLKRERDRAMIRKFKKDFLGKHAAYFCEACGKAESAGLSARYVGHGDAIYEAHHEEMLGKAPSVGMETDPSKLRLLCANCHRFAHASDRLTLDLLREVLPLAKANP